MDSENLNKSPVRERLLIGLMIFLVAFLIYYIIMNMLSPGRKVKALTEELSVRADEKSKPDERIFTDSAYLKLFKEKSFLQSRITMAETDSIYLTMNLADSTISLEISGVAVHNSKIRKVGLSKMIRKGNEYLISSMLSHPFTISKNYSSIPKEPLMIKMAPKDTSEFKPDIMPDTVDVEPVNYIMEMDNSCRIIVYQDEKINPGDALHLFMFDLKYKLRNTLQSMKSVIFFRIPEYHPYIKVRLPRTDAKIIYRALPAHGQIAVYR